MIPQVSGRTARCSRAFFAIPTLLIGGSLLFALTTKALAFVIPPQVAELAVAGDRIVVAKVDSIRGFGFLGNRSAKATVKEIGKGPKLEVVEYRVSPTDACDIADAREGESVLLFLEKDLAGGHAIAWSGRGRMPIKTIGDVEYATYSNVIFPDATPRIDVPGKPLDGYNSALDLTIVNHQVKKALD